MTPAPRVSMVMTAWNGERYIDEAITSVLAQSFADFELIIVDDGSTDGTAEIIARHAAADPRIRVITQANQGIVRAANAGCALARGEYLGRFDSDDVCFPDRLARQVEFLDRHSDIAVVGGTAEVIDARGPTGGFLRYHPGNSSLRHLLEEACLIIQPAVLMRRSVFEAVGGYRRCFIAGSDYDLWLRIADSHDLANLPDPPVIRYRVHAAQVSEKQKRHQAIGALAARTATRARRAAGNDPLDAAEDLSPDVLAYLGLDEQAVEAAVVETDLVRLSIKIPTASAAELQNAIDTVTRLAEPRGWRWYGKRVGSIKALVDKEIEIRNVKLLLAAGKPLGATRAWIAAVCRHPGIVKRTINRIFCGNTATAVFVRSPRGRPVNTAGHRLGFSALVARFPRQRRMKDEDVSS